MTPDTEVPEAGLRERKKQQTRELIVQVALDLFLKQGFAATTIPEIAEAADVSPRTVSSYFPAKEDLVFDLTAAMFDRLAARLSERRDGETTAEALRDWIAAETPKWGADEQIVRRRRVIFESEHLQAYSKRFIARGEEIVAQSIASDLGGHPDDLEARMASAATLALFGVLDSYKEEQAAAGPPSADQCGPAVSREEALELVDRALLFVSAGIRALQLARAEDAAVSPT
ncbi:MAG: TetR family transcriptional regulator [Solirubrobacteraceae bacterium]|nr:TetR family transcriptional regulator [Solirubrobacteraceae bacterium]